MSKRHSRRAQFDDKPDGSGGETKCLETNCNMG